VALMCTDETKRQLLRVGGGFARIFGPDGSPVGTPLAEDVEGLLIADLDLGLIPLAKAAADPAGHYSRPDVTRLLLNRSPAVRVVEQRVPTFEDSPPFLAVSAEETAGVLRTEA